MREDFFGDELDPPAEARRGVLSPHNETHGLLERDLPGADAPKRTMQAKENIVVNLWWRRYFKAVGWLAIAMAAIGVVLIIPLTLLIGPFAIAIALFFFLIAAWTSHLRGMAYVRMTQYVLAERCPACGGDLSYDTESERYKCALCGKVFWISRSGCAYEL